MQIDFRRIFEMVFWISALIALAVSYAIYIPMPAETVLDRIKIQVFELAMRIVYFYPMNALKLIDVRWQVWWARRSLGFLVRILRYRMWTQPHDGIRVSKADFDGVPIIVYEPRQRLSKAALVLIHGGGFVLMDADSYAQLARQLVVLTGLAVFNIDYRNAPEHVFPAALDDCETAISHLLNHAYERYGVDPSRVAIIGDSAGGNLAAGSIFRLMDNAAQLVKPKLQVLIYPLLQFVDFQTPSYREAGVLYGGSALADPESIVRWVSLYFGLTGTEADLFLRNGHLRKDSIAERAPYLLRDMQHKDLPFNVTHEHTHACTELISTFSPSKRWPIEDVKELQRRLEPILFNAEVSPIMRRDLSVSPKTFLITCEYDPLRDEGYWYAKRLEKAGVHVKWTHYMKAFHGIINLHAEFYLAERMLMDIVHFIHANL